MNAIAGALKTARSIKIKDKGKRGKVNLEVEVIWSAFKAMKDDPSISIPQAMSHGLAEWEK